MEFTLFLDNGEQLDIETEDYTEPTRTVMEYLIYMLEYYETELFACDVENELLAQQVEYGKLLNDLLKPEIKN